MRAFDERALEPSLLTLDEAAVVAGVSASTFKRLARAGRVGPMPVRFSARLVRWSRPELEQWIAAGCPTRKDWQARKAVSP